MARRGTDNLRSYVEGAVLPDMLNATTAPPMPAGATHKSHRNHLAVVPEPYRRLHNVLSIDQTRSDLTPLDDRIEAWMDKNIPNFALDAEDEDVANGDTLTVPSSRLYDIPFTNPRRPDGMGRLLPWIDNLPLQTVQRLMHLIDHDTMNWGFSALPNNDIDKDIFQTYIWKLNREMKRPDLAKLVGEMSVLVAVQPPWVLTEADIKSFARPGNFEENPDSDDEDNSTPFTSRERLWAKLWDACAANSCNFFVVTSYHHWVFGCFTSGRSVAYISPVCRHDDFRPTVVERLLFWVGSAMKLKCTFSIPKIPEPNFTVNDLPEFRQLDNLGTPAPSESEWSCKGSDAGSSAGFDREITPLVSEGYTSGPSTPLARPLELCADMVNEWVWDSYDAKAGLYDEPKTPIMRPLIVDGMPWLG